MNDKRTEFQLNNGRTIYLESINQWKTYSGLLEGLPTRRMNDRTIKGIVSNLKKTSGNDPYLIEPVESPIDLDYDYPFGEPAQLPRIVCIASFHCLKPVQDDSMDYSDLSVVWFQNQFAFPIDESAQNAIRSIAWKAYAIDGWY